MYSSKIIEDSVAPSGVRLTTFAVKYPRFVHGEMLTHKLFSRNSSSSRAIPFKKSLEYIKDNPVVPVYWGVNQQGMQAFTEHDNIDLCEKTWKKAKDSAIDQAIALNELGLHKQIVNRVIEPFSWITTIITATDFDNFFALRCHKDAQPEIRFIAELMKNCYEESVPRKLKAGEWHLPFVTNEEKMQHTVDECLMMSTARCARVSYMNHDGTSASFEKDKILYDKLVNAHPAHSSPTEHQGMALGFGYKIKNKLHNMLFGSDFYIGNFRGWLQYRKTIKGESVKNKI